MKRAQTILLIMLFLVGICIVPNGIISPARLQDDRVTFADARNNDVETAELPNDRVFRVAFYNETNTTAPDYAVLSLTNNYTQIYDVLSSSSYDVTKINSTDIENYELNTANYDVVILADNVPRENITKHVKDFWLAGGGVLAIDSAAAFLVYGGILPRENESQSHGFLEWWKYSSTNVSEIVEKTPISQSYANGSYLVHDYASWAVYNWTALMDTSVSPYLTKIARLNGSDDLVTAISIDAPDKGGRAAFFGVPVPDFPTDWESMLLDAIGWLAPRPKGKILFDVAHNNYYPVDAGDPTGFNSDSRFSTLRDDLVSRRYTFDKLWPSVGNFTAGVLAPYDIVIINTPEINFTASEVTAINDWVNAGGSLIALGDNSGFLDEHQNLNYLLSNSDLRINLTDNYNTFSFTTTELMNHPTMEDVDELEFSGGTYVNYSGSATPLAMDEQNTVIAFQEIGDGRILLAGDINFLSNVDSANNSKWAVNVANWLTADDAKVLLYTDDPYGGNYYRTMVADALNQLEIPFYLTYTETGLNATLNGTWYGDDWDLTIIDNCNWQRQDSYPHILDYLETGKQMILTSWTFEFEKEDPLWSFIGVNWTETIMSNAPSYIWDNSHPIFDGLVNYNAPTLNIASTGFTIDGFKLQVFDNATALTGATPTEQDGNGSIVLTNTNQVLFNGFMLNGLRGDADSSAYMDGFEIYLNEINFMLNLPEIDHPADIQYEDGSTGHSITWNPTDSSPDTYQVFIDGSVVDSGSWDGSAINVNVDAIGLGFHTVECRVIGDSGHPRGDIVFVTVVDTTAPLISNPSDMEMEAGTTGNTLTWVASDANPSHYVILLNSTEYDSGVWDGDSVVLDLDDLTPGTYFFTLKVNDTLGHLSEDIVLVTVTEPTGGPIIPGLPEWLDTQTLLLIVIGVLALIIIVMAVRRRK
ncbi:MAG: membrane protein of unknown function [Candidatus Thorarchaeota archaeon]|nr:MAG: membrane protein of unknown function [Candidatus Thorarchaeota archaeon]